MYQATIEVLGKAKSNPSTFFPKSWSAQKVIDAINEAYNIICADKAKALVQGSRNTYSAVLKNGMEIQMYLDSANKIISAYPIY